MERKLASYAPFPAILVSPLFVVAFPSSTTVVSLQWSGSTITSGATISYNLYFGTSNDPPIKRQELQQLQQVSLFKHTTGKSAPPIKPATLPSRRFRISV